MTYQCHSTHGQANGKANGSATHWCYQKKMMSTNQKSCQTNKPKFFVFSNKVLISLGLNYASGDIT